MPARLLQVLAHMVSRSQPITFFKASQDRQMFNRLLSPRCALARLTVLHQTAKLVETTNRLNVKSVAGKTGQRLVELSIRFEQLLGRHGQVAAICNELLLLLAASQGFGIDHERWGKQPCRLDDRAVQTLTEVGLAHRLEAFPATLSGGES